MRCPSCTTQELKPTKLDAGLAGYGCARCRGVLIELLSYRMWAESHAANRRDVRAAAPSAEDSKRAFACPKCSKLMTKYRIADEVANKLDLCTHCGEVWLDGGEWDLLLQLDLAASLPQILSDPWQNAIRKKHVTQSVEQKFQALFGPQDYQKLKEFRDWMLAHENAPDIQDYLHRTPIS